MPTSGLIEGLRAVKDGAEVARIETAARVVDAALGEVIPLLKDRPTERTFARELDAAIRAGGADDLGFDTIVASGPNSARPHHSPGDRTIEQGDLVIVDVGGRVDGYRSDMTRTFCVGPMTAQQRQHFDTVVGAQQAGVEAMVDGARTADVDRAARDIIDVAGWGASFTHGTGHGVGLDIHELPRVARGVEDRYCVGVVATVEPGVYLAGVAGVRIEDTCLVTTEGARRLTGYTKVARGRLVAPPPADYSLRGFELGDRVGIGVDELLLQVDANLVPQDLHFERAPSAFAHGLGQFDLFGLEFGEQRQPVGGHAVELFEERVELLIAHVFGVQTGSLERVFLAGPSSGLDRRQAWFEPLL